jgi:hypothetical protein
MTGQFDPAAAQPDPKRDRYGRYLLPDPDGGKKELPWTRATTFAKTLADTFALSQWGERMTAKGIGLRPDLYALACSAGVEDKDTLNKVAAQAKDAASAAAGANLGTALHSFTESLDRGEQPVVPEPWAADVEAYRAAMAASGMVTVPTLIERIVVIPQYRVAGCFDRILQTTQAQISARRHLIGDLKTAKRVDYSWNEIAIQLALYAHGAAIWNAVTGQYEPMPAVDQNTAIVMHVPVGKGRCDLYEVDIAAGWAVAGTCQAVRTWRGRRDLAQPFGTDALAPLRRAATTNDLTARISEAASVADLEALWVEAAAAGTWTTAATAAAKARKEKLLATTAR